MGLEIKRLNYSILFYEIVVYMYMLYPRWNEWNPSVGKKLKNNIASIKTRKSNETKIKRWQISMITQRFRKTNWIYNRAHIKNDSSTANAITNCFRTLRKTYIS